VPSLKERPLGISELAVKDFGPIFDKSSASWAIALDLETNDDIVVYPTPSSLSKASLLVTTLCSMNKIIIDLHSMGPLELESKMFELIRSYKAIDSDYTKFVTTWEIRKNQPFITTNKLINSWSVVLPTSCETHVSSFKISQEFSEGYFYITYINIYEDNMKTIETISHEIIINKVSLAGGIPCNYLSKALGLEINIL
jgi:hypothetical protein